MQHQHGPDTANFHFFTSGGLLSQSGAQLFDYYYEQEGRKWGDVRGFSPQDGCNLETPLFFERHSLVAFLRDRGVDASSQSAFSGFLPKGGGGLNFLWGRVPPFPFPPSDSPLHK